MGVGVGYAAEDRVIFGQQVEAAEVDPQRGYQQKQSKSDGEAAPGQRVVNTVQSFERTGAPGNHDEENREPAGNHGQQHQPAGDELPRRKS